MAIKPHRELERKATWIATGRLIAAARGSRTQGDIAGPAGLTQSQMSELENGNLSLTTATAWQKLLKALGCKLEDIIPSPSQIRAVMDEARRRLLEQDRKKSRGSRSARNSDLEREQDGQDAN